MYARCRAPVDNSRHSSPDVDEVDTTDGGLNENTVSASQMNSVVQVDHCQVTATAAACSYTAKSADDVEGGDEGNEYDDEEEEDADDVDQGLPFPGFVPTAFYCFDQTKQPRLWCLQLITWPYPLM